jgi:hypothetical protein
MFEAGVFAAADAVFDSGLGAVSGVEWAASRFPDSWLVAILRCSLPI